MAILELKNVSYSYNNLHHPVEAIKDMSHSFERGKVYAIVGKSGSGKSTLLSLLAGLDTPHSGKIFFEGIATADMDLDEYRRTCTAVIYQNFRLFPLLTALENVMYPMELCNLKGRKAENTAIGLLEKVALPVNARDRFPGMLSGGEQQRVAIARALSMNRRVILADEPTGNLDTENGDNIIEILINLAHEDNYCVLIATHDLNIIQKTDEVLYISDGKIAGHE
ncbi:MAG: ABC transporter ATP-binding protein [Clostridia bacterium]|nr:ABC transporter ATP-binding protein [Clostridia bacterium]